MLASHLSMHLPSKRYFRSLHLKQVLAPAPPHVWHDCSEHWQEDPKLDTLPKQLATQLVAAAQIRSVVGVNGAASNVLAAHVFASAHILSDVGVAASNSYSPMLAMHPRDKLEHSVLDVTVPGVEAYSFTALQILCGMHFHANPGWNVPAAHDLHWRSLVAVAATAISSPALQSDIGRHSLSDVGVADVPSYVPSEHRPVSSVHSLSDVGVFAATWYSWPGMHTVAVEHTRSALSVAGLVSNSVLLLHAAVSAEHWRSDDGVGGTVSNSLPSAHSVTTAHLAPPSSAWNDPTGHVWQTASDLDVAFALSWVPALQTPTAWQIRSALSVGGDTSNPPSGSHLVIVAHARSEIADGGTDSYSSPPTQAVNAVHSRSARDVNGLDSNSRPSLQTTTFRAQT